MDRREFLAKAGLVATWAGITVTIGCSDDDGGTGPDTGGTNNVTGDVSFEGHTHNVTITGSQIMAGQAVSLTLSGGGHLHQVNLTADQVMDIGAGTRVSQDTEPDGTGHEHTVTFN